MMHFKTYTKKATLKLTILNLTQNNEHKIKKRNKKIKITQIIKLDHLEKITRMLAAFPFVRCLPKLILCIE